MTKTSGDPHDQVSAAGALPRRRLLTMALGTAAGGAAALAARPADAGAAARLLAVSATVDEAGARTDVAADWYDELAGVSTTAPGNPDRLFAIAWVAASFALHSRADGGLSTGQRSAFDDAAVATAVHDAAIATVAGAASRLDAALARSLAAVPGGEGKQAGVRAGRDAAGHVLAAREGDGLDPASLNPPFTPPPEAPGVYRLLPGATATQGAGLGRARPFLLRRADQFRPGPPPALGTARYRRDLEELRRLGAPVSERTERQSDIAWLSPQHQYGPALRALVRQRGRPLGWKVGLLAAYSAATLDAAIAVSDAKFVHLHWRPVTAIRAANTDGDPLTDPDPTWTSYLPTPPNPDYPSTHAVIAGAAERVLTHFGGPRTPVPFTATYTRGDGQLVELDYRRGTPWSTLTQENVDARVWAGVHFRFSDETGAALGRRVGDHDLRRFLERR